MHYIDCVERKRDSLVERDASQRQPFKLIWKETLLKP
jgi:hypothetical protein